MAKKGRGKKGKSPRRSSRGSSDDDEEAGLRGGRGGSRRRGKKGGGGCSSWVMLVLVLVAGFAVWSYLGYKKAQAREGGGGGGILGGGPSPPPPPTPDGGGGGGGGAGDSRYEYGCNPSDPLCCDQMLLREAEGCAHLGRLQCLAFQGCCIWNDGTQDCLNAGGSG